MKCLTAILLILIPATFVHGQDLGDAISRYEQDMETARQTVLAEWRKEITKAIGENDQAAAARWQAWMQKFELEGAFHVTADNRRFFNVYKAYCATRKQASDQLRAAYLKEISDLQN
ncbi:MAG: hypothetical protein KDA85_13915, partial [Planctomycetaceae bacterium]|nr:hypothetical protein [Planctomycetaceae bacterium]